MEGIMGKLLNVVLVGSVGFVLSVAGCGGEAPAGPKTEAVGDVGSEPQQVLTCECAAYYYCSTDGTQFWYEAAGCGWPGALVAQQQCNNYCPGPCNYGGWVC
jgi:hypothetical protein